MSIASKSLEQLVSFETFLELFEGKHTEWVNGKVVAMSRVSREHNLIVGFVVVLLRHYCEQTDEGATFHETFTMRLSPDGPAREPDVFVVAKPNIDRVKSPFVDGPADLAVEVVSPESTLRDRGEKFAEYEAAGVREYWIIDPLRRETAFYVLAEDGRFNLRSVDDEGLYQSVVLPRLRIDPSIFLRDPIPPLAEAFNLVNGLLRG